MSLDPILWALKDAPVADSLERLILVTLGERAARADGCTAFPSRDTLAGTALADPKTVQRVIQRLVKRGLIAKGDQSAARYIRADRRPVVYDLLIPYSWFPNPERMNEERRQAGLPPLTPADRPDIAPPPPRAQRSDVGKPRPKKTVGGPGDSESPRASGHGGTASPARGDSESPTGGLAVPRTPSLIHPGEPPLPPFPSPAPAPPDAQPVTEGWEGGRGAAPTNDLTSEERQAYDALARTVHASPQLALGEAELLRLVPLAVPWLARTTEDRMREALTAGLPARIGSPAGLVRRRLVEKLPPTPPAAAPSAGGLPPWCGECGDDNPAAQFNPRFRTRDGAACPACHPAAAA